MASISTSSTKAILLKEVNYYYYTVFAIKTASNKLAVFPLCDGKDLSLQNPVLPIKHCMLWFVGSHFSDVENSDAFVCHQNRTWKQ